MFCVFVLVLVLRDRVLSGFCVWSFSFVFVVVSIRVRAVQVVAGSEDGMDFR